MEELHTIAFKEARKVSTNPPDAFEMERELVAAGWKRVHASPFWKSPSGFMGASTSHAWESMKLGTDLPKHCPQCGQLIPQD